MWSDFPLRQSERPARDIAAMRQYHWISEKHQPWQEELAGAMLRIEVSFSIAFNNLNFNIMFAINFVAKVAAVKQKELLQICHSWNHGTREIAVYCHALYWLLVISPFTIRSMDHSNCLLPLQISFLNRYNRSYNRFLVIRKVACSHRSAKFRCPLTPL